MAGDNFAVMLPRIRDPRLEYKKYLNFLIALRERRRQATVVCSLPFELTVDLSTACQLRCPHCATGIRALDRPVMHLQPERHDQILESVGDSAFLLWYYCCGEPLLNPRHAELIAEAAKREVFSVISTNLSMPLSDAKIDALLLSGLGMLFVALDGTTPETYVRYRRGGDFHLVVDNMKRLVRRKRELGLDRPIIEWRFLIFRHNQHEVPFVRKMAEEIGVDDLDFFLGCAPPTGGPDTVLSAIPPFGIPEDLWSPITISGMARTDSTLRRWLANKILLPPAEAPSRLVGKKCDWHYYGAMLHPDGGVGPCCAIAYSKDDFGKLPEPKDFPRMWNNATFQRARRMFSAGEAAPDLACARCPIPAVMDFHFQKTVNGILGNAPDWALAVLASDPDSFFLELDFWNLPTAARLALARREDFGHFPRIANWLERDAVGNTPRHEQVRKILDLLGPTPEFLRSLPVVDEWTVAVHPAQLPTWVGWDLGVEFPERQFATAMPILQLDRAHGFAGIEAGPDTKLQTRNDEIIVSSTGTDPSLFLPMACAPKSRELYVRVQLVPPAESAVQVFYVPPGETGYCEQNSRSAVLKPGMCDLILRIPAGDLQQPIRLDPANRPGATIIRSIEIRAARECDVAADGADASENNTPNGAGNQRPADEPVACAVSD